MLNSFLTHVRELTHMRGEVSHPKAGMVKCYLDIPVRTHHNELFPIMMRR